jgi:hypothetical protein
VPDFGASTLSPDEPHSSWLLVAAVTVPLLLAATLILGSIALKALL